MLPWIAAELAALTDAGLLRRRREFRLLSDGWCEIDGRRVRNFAGNDYLCLASDPRVIAAAEAALREYGIGARASALVCGRTEWHAYLEQTLAAFEEQPAAILFPTGMAANIGTVAALAGAGDVIFCDRFNHASLVDGCRLSGAKLRVYRHDDLDGLAKHLSQAAGYRRRFVVTDSVFSMDGDHAPLPDLCDLAERYGADLIVDEAHATGVFGENGRGVCELMNVEHRVAVRIGTLSKALGTLGGFVTGSEELIAYLWNTARTQMFSTALPPAICFAATVAVQIVRDEPDRIRTRLGTAAGFREALAEHGVTVLKGSVGPIVPIVLGDPVRTMQVADRLEQRGYLVGAIRPPTVPNGTSRLRITVAGSHDMNQYRELAAAVAEEVRLHRS
ncbi:MAG TPA: 8-amino-7-oxononanoate synthase [Planctomycetaceae bacterium]|nr:8-amino-7-oxononanoate synthase [Planctomycetaceae bacterium]